MLRKKSEIGKTSISKRMVVSAAKMREVKEFLRDYFDVMDVPDDEDGLIKFIVDKFSVQKEHYEDLNKRYESQKYPDRLLISAAITLMNSVLSQQKDNIALIDMIIKKEDELYDNKELLQNIESFFKTQVTTFDAGVKFEEEMHNDIDYISRDDEAHQALNQIRLITMIPTTGTYDYKRIPELNSLIATVKAAHDAMVDEKRKELFEIVRQCMEAIHTAADGDTKVKQLSDKGDSFYSQKKEHIANTSCLALLDGLIPPMWQYKDNIVERIEAATKPQPQPTLVKEGAGSYSPQKKEIIKAIPRQAMFPAKTLKSEADIDDYVEKVREQMKQMLHGADGIRIN